MTGSFEGKVALVTGAGGGIGLATAEAFANAGASVILADCDEKAIGKAAEGLRAAGHNAIGVTCDVTDAVQVEAMIERAVRTYGRLDAAFNNAGVNSDAAAFLDTSDDEFERVMNVNLRGVWNCMKGELQQMMAQGSGAIVNCSSIGGEAPPALRQEKSPRALRRLSGRGHHDQAIERSAGSGGRVGERVARRYKSAGAISRCG